MARWNTIDEFSDSELAEEFADRMNINDYELVKFLKGRTLADTLKFELFVENIKRIDLVKFDQFLKTTCK